MRIGITGHQSLEKKVTEWLEIEIENEIHRLSPSKAYSCLAIGADQIFAHVALLNNIPLVAVIPCIEYQSTFDDENLQSYLDLLKKSSEIITLPFTAPSQNAFYDAGKRLVENSDIIIAIWNSQVAKGLGGTADVVNYAKNLKKSILHLDPTKKTRKYINYI